MPSSDTLSNDRVATGRNYSAHIFGNSKPMDYQAKNALDGCTGSIGAVLDYLRRNGVARATLQELRSAIEEDRHVFVLERCQEYVDACSPSNESSGFLLLICAWTTVCRHTSLQYKRAYKHYHSLRQSAGSCGAQQSKQWGRSYHSPTELETALQEQIKLAELCCASQKGLILAQARNRQCSVRLQ
jgi:hypothetical protein